MVNYLRTTTRNDSVKVLNPINNTEIDVRLQRIKKTTLLKRGFYERETGFEPAT